MNKRAFITGISGQDGAYLSALLLKNGYSVSGIARNTDDEACWRLQELGIRHDVELLQGDIGDATFTEECMRNTQPDELYNLAAQSVSADTSWEQAEETMRTNTNGVKHLLDSIANHSPTTRIFQAGSSEMYGNTGTDIVDENTPFHPLSPYGISKLDAHQFIQDARKKHGLFACTGILFNHESPLRGTRYVTRIITMGIAQIYTKQIDVMALGNLDAKRDWSFAGDIVEAMWKMLQQDIPEDYVLASGTLHCIRDVLTVGFAHIGIEDWSSYVKQDPAFQRKTELPSLRGNTTKAKTLLQWQPHTSFEEMIRSMVDADISRLQQ